jgi:transposase-like protein
MARRGSDVTAAVLGARRWTAAEAASVLAAASASGLSSRRFAIERGLDPQRLARWRRQLEGAAVGEATFVELVPAQAPAVRASGFEVVLAGGRVVRVALGFDSDELRRLLAVVDDGAC